MNGEGDAVNSRALMTSYLGFCDGRGWSLPTGVTGNVEDEIRLCTKSGECVERWPKVGKSMVNSGRRGSVSLGGDVLVMEENRFGEWGRNEARRAGAFERVRRLKGLMKVRGRSGAVVELESRARGKGKGWDGDKRGATSFVGGREGSDEGILTMGSEWNGSGSKKMDRESSTTDGGCVTMYANVGIGAGGMKPGDGGVKSGACCCRLP
jgi:hypothetical protein